MSFTADFLCGQLAGLYHVYYGVHEDEENIHIHFAINAVSYVDGKKLHKNMKQLEEMETEMREIAKAVFEC